MRRLLLLASLPLLLLCQTAAAQQPADSPPETKAPSRAWAEGVAEKAQALALEEFRKGNKYFAASDYGGSVSFYREGLKHWDHPALHGNLAVALLRLDQPIVAHRHIKLALRWDALPLEPHIYEQLITSLHVLEGQLAQISASCNEADGAYVTLDGEEFTVCPASSMRYALAGVHELVARKDNYLTMVNRFHANPGQVARIQISLVPLADAAQYERRFAAWKPWAVLAAGAGVTLLGVSLSLSANSNFSEHDQEINRLCPNGCPREEIPDAITNLSSRAKIQKSVAIGSFVTGGITLAAGAALLYLNRSTRIEVDADGRRLSLVPQASRDAVGIAALLPF